MNSIELANKIHSPNFSIISSNASWTAALHDHLNTTEKRRFGTIPAIQFPNISFILQHVDISPSLRANLH